MGKKKSEHSWCSRRTVCHCLWDFSLLCTMALSPGSCVRESPWWMDGWMWLVGVFHHDFPWGSLSVGRAQPPQRWYLLQTRQLTDSSPLCIFPQRRTVLICFLYGIFDYNPYMTCRFPVLHSEPKKNARGVRGSVSPWHPSVSIFKWPGI